ncbi:hypothetical protein [Halalkalicoccus tibetensis]|uniref:Tat (Twin-arginine translocation) pathway signal sequence n=1 Tax=Halalkalicoccus tibetensis TaxID=175632 RepID=A0ABD5V2W0_9EURY
MPSITRRRLVTGGAVAAGSILGLGYAYRERVELAVLGTIRGCPGPGDAELPGTELGYEVRAVEGEPLIGGEYAPDIALLTSSDDVESLSLDGRSEPREFVEGTDFEGSTLIAVQVIGSGQSEGVRFVGVERLKDGTLRSYSCVTRPSGHDDAYPYGWLVRADTASHSEVARHTHGGGNTDVDVEAG